MNRSQARRVALPALASLLLPAGCANFRKLSSDLTFMETTRIVSVSIRNADEHHAIQGLVVEWDQKAGKVLSADVTTAGALGAFAFFVKSPRNQFVMAYSDRDGNGHYDPGEPAWIHSGADGKASPVTFDAGGRARVTGSLSPSVVPPPGLVDAALAFRGARTTAEAATGWDIPIALGEIARLDDPRFSAARGEEGLWLPARFPLDTGVGIYFLEPYDPARIPVLFVYGISGSPQDWRTFFATLDRTKYQPWFYLYPTGRRLDEVGGVLNRCVETLQGSLGFERLHVVAHSMGGLVARSFLVKNVLEDRNRYCTRFVSISTPWAGHEAAAMGVSFSFAVDVVPAWRDLASGSRFQQDLLSKPLKGHVDHLLVYGHHGSLSLVLPPENDGTVSVASQLAPAARENAVMVIGVDADHVGILSRPDVVQAVEAFLGGEGR
jgi:pimeloyl-ACP methyl ester carboxylesterase